MTASHTTAASTSTPTVPDTHQKALALNLDATSFGSFAEIGAGQEVARWFLRVGAASGTVAKTVSAYDKEVSDDLYGSGTRYVSKPRVQAMLESEWKALIHQVGQQRGATTRFFSFANTIAARNFAGTNDCHGWLGLRFQLHPQAEPGDILLHVNLRDHANLLQQEAVGILGVNLVHALLAREPATAADLPARLFDNLDASRIEIDQLELRGSMFTGCDERALHVALATQGRAEAITLTDGGTALAANEFLYKKAIIIAPVGADGRDDLSPQALAACVQAVRKEVAGNEQVKDVINIRLITTHPQSPAPSTIHGPALITRHPQLYRATSFVRRYTQAPLRFAMTLPGLMRIFAQVRDQEQSVRMLEGVAKLFGHDVRVLAYPSPREDMQRLLTPEAGKGWTLDGSGAWATASQARPTAPLLHLYEYLRATGFLVAMDPP